MRFGCVIFFSFMLSLTSAEEIVIRVEADKVSEFDSAFDIHFKKAEITKSKANNLGEFLSNVRGFQITKTYQGLSSVSFRGLPAGNILVFWNGIKLNDPLDPSTSFDFSRLELGSASHIQIIRGPEASLWGSGATGAVIFIDSLSVENERSSKQVAASLASYDTIQGEFQSKIIREKSKTQFYAQSHYSRGISAADVKLGNSERDPRFSIHGHTFESYQLNERFKINAVASAHQTKSDADLRGGIGGDDLIAQDSQTAFAGALQAHYVLDNYENKTLISFSNDRRYHLNSVEYAKYKSNALRIENSHRYKINNSITLSPALDFEYEYGKSLESYGNFSAEKQSIGGRLHLDSNLSTFNIKTGIRFQKDLKLKDPGSFAFFLNPSIAIQKTSSIFGVSMGRSFKKPSLYQLFFELWQKTLAAEKLWSLEANYLQDMTSLKSQFNITSFWNQSHNSIDYDFTTQKYSNEGKRENHGIEATLTTQWISSLKSSIDYTWTQSRALRVARQKGTLHIEYLPTKNLSFSTQLQHIGSRKDIDAISYKEKKMPSYQLWGLRLGYQLTKQLETSLRVDNVLDKHYQEIDGYGYQGRYFEVQSKFNF